MIPQLSILYGRPQRALAAVASFAFLIASVTTMVPRADGQTFTVIHDFTGGTDGANPQSGVILDQGGNAFGTAYHGGSGCSPLGCGLVYKLQKRSGSWTETPLYTFTGGADGAFPQAGVVFGSDGR